MFNITTEQLYKEVSEMYNETYAFQLYQKEGTVGLYNEIKDAQLFYIQVYGYEM